MFRMIPVDELRYDMRAYCRGDRDTNQARLLADARLLAEIGDDCITEPLTVKYGDGWMVTDGVRRMYAAKRLQNFVRHLTGLPFVLKVPCNIV